MSGFASSSSDRKRDQFVSYSQVRTTETNPDRSQRTVTLITLNIRSLRDAKGTQVSKPWSEPINHWALKVGSQLWELRADGNGSYYAKSVPWSGSKDGFISSQEIVGQS